VGFFCAKTSGKKLYKIVVFVTFHRLLQKIQINVIGFWLRFWDDDFIFSFCKWYFIVGKILFGRIMITAIIGTVALTALFIEWLPCGMVNVQHKGFVFALRTKVFASL
jgi:hypothetical protein